MKITETIIKRWRLTREGFSLVELLLGVAVLSMIAAVAVFSINSLITPARGAKLQSDVARLNGAVKTFLVNGGSIPAAATGDDVLARLKTVSEATSGQKLAGLRGSMIDRRLRGVTVVAPGTERAVWNPAKLRFEISTAGTGFGEFDFGADDTAPAAAAVRTGSMELATRDKWVWDFQESGTGRDTPVGVATVSATPEEAQDPSPIVQLAAPDFSLRGAIYDFSAFNPSLDVSLINRNTPGVSRVIYSINGGAWEEYRDTPLKIFPESTTVVRAYAVPLNADGFEASEVQTEQYETIYFSGTVAGQFHTPVGDRGLVTNLGPGARDNRFAWGSPATDDRKQNELQFRGGSFSKVAPDQEFELGTLSYYNGTTFANTNATAVQIAMDLNLSTPAVRESLNFEFRLLSTPNKGVSKDEDADYVWIPDVSTSFRTTIKGKTFALVLRFGEHTANGFTTIDTFHAHEGRELRGTIYGRLTEVR